MKINLFLGAMEPILGRGLVMRTVSDDQMGIQFDGLSLGASSRLQDFLLRLIHA